MGITVAAARPAMLQPTSRRRLVGVLAQLVREKPLGTVGAGLVVVALLMALFADVLAPYGFNDFELRDRLQPSSLAHLLGTDGNGRDLLSRVLYGARVSLAVGFGSVTTGIVIGTTIGLLSAYFSGVVDNVLQRGVDTVMSFPGLVLVLTVLAVLGPGIERVIVVLALFYGITGSRVIRGAALSVKENAYVEAARALGARTPRIILVHLLPNVMAPVIVLATVQLGSAILVEASLSFLGFGVAPPHPSWGGMLSAEGRQYMLRAPWLAIWPGLALSLTVFGFNMLGDALRDILDPRLHSSS